MKTLRKSLNINWVGPEVYTNRWETPTFRVIQPLSHDISTTTWTIPTKLGECFSCSVASLFCAVCCSSKTLHDILWWFFVLCSTCNNLLSTTLFVTCEAEKNTLLLRENWKSQHNSFNSRSILMKHTPKTHRSLVYPQIRPNNSKSCELPPKK